MFEPWTAVIAGCVGGAIGVALSQLGHHLYDRWSGERKRRRHAAVLAASIIQPGEGRVWEFSSAGESWHNHHLSIKIDFDSPDISFGVGMIPKVSAWLSDWKTDRSAEGRYEYVSKGKQFIAVGLVSDRFHTNTAAIVVMNQSDVPVTITQFFAMIQAISMLDLVMWQRLIDITACRVVRRAVQLEKAGDIGSGNATVGQV